MSLTNSALNYIAQAVINDSPTFFNNTNTYLAVGDGTTAFSASQTDLQGTNKLRKKVDATYPTRTNNSITFKATFTTSDANWAWNEWGIFNASTGGIMLNRKVENLGTKTSSATWVFTVTLTFTTS
jgi:hypothetical protein